MINKNNQKENSKIIPYQYKVGEKVLLQNRTENKYEILFSGSHYKTEDNDSGILKI